MLLETLRHLERLFCGIGYWFGDWADGVDTEFHEVLRVAIDEPVSRELKGLTPEEAESADAFDWVMRREAAYEAGTDDNSEVNVGSEIDKAISILNWYQTVKPDIARLIGLVQENQWFFGNPPAGESCLKLAADKLEELVAKAQTDDNSEGE